MKVWLQFGDKRIEKRKTPIFKCTLNPVFNEAFSFNVPWEKIRECSLDVMVMDFDNIGRNELIGRIQLAGGFPAITSSHVACTAPIITTTPRACGWNPIERGVPVPKARAELPQGFGCITHSNDSLGVSNSVYEIHGTVSTSIILYG